MQGRKGAQAPFFYPIFVDKLVLTIADRTVASMLEAELRDKNIRLKGLLKAGG
jgi:hypothetical protein